jgi:hypothetical protein
LVKERANAHCEHAVALQPVVVVVLVEELPAPPFGRTLRHAAIAAADLAL